MKWKELKRAYSELLIKVRENKNFLKNGISLKKLLMKFQKASSRRFIYSLFTKYFRKKKIDKKNIYIFDHGIGSGMKSIYLAAIGYYNVHGVDRSGDVSALNKILKKMFGIKKKTFIKLMVKNIPFPDNYFNFIMSIQVAEHVTNDLMILIILRKVEFLKEGGYVYHELPHKLIPFESHSRLWLIHLFPSFLNRFCMEFLFRYNKKPIFKR